MWVGLKHVIVVFPDHTQLLLYVVLELKKTLYIDQPRKASPGDSHVCRFEVQ